MKIVIGLFVLTLNANIKKSYIINKLQQFIDSLKILITTFMDMDKQVDSHPLKTNREDETCNKCPFNGFIEYVSLYIEIFCYSIKFN